MRLLFLLLFAGALSAQHTIEPLGDGNYRCWMIRTEHAEQVAPKRIVVFLHGFGAQNPGVYGGWIRHLLADDPATLVLFPKFQTGLWAPRGEVFTQRTQETLENTLTELRGRYPTLPRSVTLIGHSIGGAIAANLADREATLRNFSIDGVMLVQPGHKVFRCGRQETYTNVRPDLPVLLVTGADDGASGDQFANHFVATAPQVEQLLFVRHRAGRSGDEVMKAQHKTPVSPVRRLYTPNFNLITEGAKWVGREDRADTHCFYRMSDALLRCAEAGECAGLDPEASATLSMGRFANGEAVPPLELVVHRR